MTIKFKPMLASPADLRTLRFPVYASPKLDGIRACVVNGKLLTRSLKRVPNRSISEALSLRIYEGLDGELIVGKPYAPNVYRQTVSGVMSQAGEPDWAFYAFDLHDIKAPFESRHQMLKNMHAAPPLLNPKIVLHDQCKLFSIDQIDAYEQTCLALGYEGVILRSPTAPYKYGRSTSSEQYLLKLKRFEDSEAEIIGMEEEMHNANEAQTNALGYTERTSHQANQHAKGTMGALCVRDIKTGVEFKIGTGFSAMERQSFWDGPRTLGKVVKYRFLPVGVKDKPRHPSYLGLRDRSDL